MTREELIDKLSDLEDYHTVTQKTCEFLKLDLLKKDYHYNAGNDSRIADLFDYLSPTEAGFPQYIDYAAFAIVANVSRFGMNIPTNAQMLQMLKISGYTGQEMENYVRSNLSGKVSCLSVKHLVPAVCLLARVLADAMMDKSEWQGYRKGKKKKNYTPMPNLSMKKFQTLVEYMEENDLLCLHTMDGAEYTKFVCNHSRYMCRLASVQKELRIVSDAIERQQRALAGETMREARRLLKKKPGKKPQRTGFPKAGAAKSTLIAPLASPSASLPPIPAPVEIPAMLQTQPPTIYSSLSPDMDLQDFRDIPPEINALLKQIEQFDDEAGALQEECWTISDQLAEENSAERAEYISDEFIPSVATGFFQSIRNGDEIYKLNVGRIVIEDLMAMSDMPLPSSFTTELDDDDEWDYTFTECNGKLALPLIKEGECLSFPLDEEMEEFRYTIPITAMISRYAERPFEAPLYIRKSLIKKLKEYGCSDRKARDYAVIIATLIKVNLLEGEDVRFAAEYPDSEEKEPEATPEERSDARVQAEAAARKEAERALHQAQKENQICRHEISTLQREIERLKNQLAEKELPVTEHAGTPEEDAEIAIKDVQYPYRTNLRVILYGGFDVFHRELLKLLPDVRVIETSAHIDVNPVRNADIVFLQINKTDHSGYWTVCDACKNSNVPYIHLNYASAKRCAGVMVEEMRKIEKGAAKAPSQ